MYEDEIITNVPAPNTNADFDASLHITKSTEKLATSTKLGPKFAQLE